MSISTHPLSYLLLNAEEQYRKALRSIVGYPWSLLMSLVSIMAESRKTQANEISQEVSPSSSNCELRSNDQFCFILSTIGKESLKVLYTLLYISILNFINYPLTLSNTVLLTLVYRMSQLELLTSWNWSIVDFFTCFIPILSYSL